MALLLKDSDTPTEVSETTAERPLQTGACPNCGATLGRGQDWCLECGTAAPGRIGGHPAGWRTAATLIVVTMLLVGGAVVASYAALTGDAERQANRPISGSGAPITAQAGPDQPPQAPARPTGPGTDPKAVRPPVTKPVTPLKISVPKVVTPPPAASIPATPAAPAKPVVPPLQTIKLADDAALTYDPYKRAGAELGTPKKAIDDSPTSVWDVVVPADNAPLGVGLVLDLGGDYSLSSLSLATPTPGFNVELYGTTSDKVPDDILDGRWISLANVKGATDGRTVKLTGKTDKKLRKVVLWFTSAGHPEDPRVAIGDVSIRGRT